MASLNTLDNGINKIDKENAQITKQYPHGFLIKQKRKLENEVQISSATEHGVRGLPIPDIWEAKAGSTPDKALKPVQGQ